MSHFGEMGVTLRRNGSQLRRKWVSTLEKWVSHFGEMGVNLVEMSVIA